LSWHIGSKLSEFLLKMYAIHGHKRLDDDVCFWNLSRSFHESADVFSMLWGAVQLKRKKLSPDNLRMSGSSFWARMLSWQYALFTLAPNLSNLIVTNPVLGKNLEQPRLTRYRDVGQVRWKIYIYTTYNFSHFAIYLPVTCTNQSLLSVVSTRSRWAFNSNEQTMSTCKWNTEKLKNLTNKMCIKTTINAQFNRTINTVTEINRSTALVVIVCSLFAACICAREVVHRSRARWSRLRSQGQDPRTGSMCTPCISVALIACIM